jgi:pyruvate dehydrogenase E2 component (dihydrolipoamide acetyltransferase)
MIEISMPRLSDSMEEGTILRWLAAEGAEVKRGDELAEIETDKASMVYEADAEGALHIVAAEGETLPVGAPIAQLLAAGEPASEPAMAVQTAVREPAAPAPIAEPAAPEPATASSAAGERVKASPLARRLAAGAGVELSSVPGSGPGGRVVRADVERAMGNGAAPSTPAPPKGETELVELSRTQALIARRMAEAKATIPEFTLQCEIDMEDAVALRAQLKSVAQRQNQPVPSFNDMIIKACALALREYPRANGTYKDGRFELHPRVNVGVAVAAGDALLVPVVRDADTSTLWEIAAQTRRLALEARDGTITPPELAGGTFSVSNLGMFGIDAFTAVINPPQAAILAVGSLAPRAVVREGQLLARHTMTVTLSCDHRILYGADAAQFLGAVRDLLQQPLALVV